MRDFFQKHKKILPNSKLFNGCVLDVIVISHIINNNLDYSPASDKDAEVIQITFTWIVNCSFQSSVSC